MRIKRNPEAIYHSKVEVAEENGATHDIVHLIMARANTQRDGYTRPKRYLDGYHLPHT